MPEDMILGLMEGNEEWGSRVYDFLKEHMDWSDQEVYEVVKEWDFK